MSWPILPDNKMISRDAWGNAIIVDKPQSIAGVLQLVESGAHLRNRSRGSRSKGTKNVDPLQAIVFVGL